MANQLLLTNAMSASSSPIPQERGGPICCGLTRRLFCQQHPPVCRPLQAQSAPLCSAFGSHLIRPDLHRLPPAEPFSATLTLAASLVRA